MGPGSMIIEGRLYAGINVPPWALKKLFFSSLTIHCVHFTRFTSCSSQFLNNITVICSACQDYDPYIDSKLYGEPDLKWLLVKRGHLIF